MKLFRIIRYCCFGLAFLFGSTAVVAKESPPQLMRDITKVTDNLYRFQYNHHVSTFLVTDEGIVLVDITNDDAAVWLSKQITALFNKPVKYLIYSHHHTDHIGGARLFEKQGAIIVAHEITKNIIEKEIESRRLPVPDLHFNDRMTLSVGGNSIELLPVVPAAHADGHIFVNFIDQRAIFSVDLAPVDDVSWMNFNDIIFLDLIDALTYLESLDWDIWVSGHYKVAGKADIANHKKYLLALKEEVTKAIAKGLSITETKKAIRLDEFKDYPLYELWMPLNVEGAYRELKFAAAGAPEARERHRVESPWEDPENTDELVLLCAFCHGHNGISPNPMWPNLAGQKKEYLQKAFLDFYDARRHDENMSAMPHYITRKEIDGLAEYYSLVNSDAYKDRVAKIGEINYKYEQSLMPHLSGESIVPDSAKAMGPMLKPNRKLIEGGKAISGACAACHGQEGVSTSPKFPNVAGQNFLYIIKQLKEFRAGVRPSPEMNTFAANLTDMDIMKLAAYYSSL